MKQRLSILGSTGSIGTQTLDIVRDHSDKFKVDAICANSNVEMLEAQAREFNPKLVAVADENCAKDLRASLDWADVIVVGPGLGRGTDALACLQSVIEDSDKPLVIDADGLNALSRVGVEILKNANCKIYKKVFIFTENYAIL